MPRQVPESKLQIEQVDQQTAQLEQMNRQLIRQDEILKNLKIENEYLVKQLENIRRDNVTPPLRHSSQPP